jgi:hypothetical protein
MGTWTNFYINTDQETQVVQKLQALTDDLEVTYNTNFPDDVGDFRMLNPDLAPNYIAVGKTQPDWTTVVHNSFDKLEDWALYLSKEFHSRLIVTIAQSVSSSYYFALYDNGIKLREIETCYSDDFEIVDSGDKLEFENEEQPGRKLEYDDRQSYLFDFESIEDYCQHFNLVIQTNYNDVKWTVLKGKDLRSEVAYFLQKDMVKKPCWKFW